MSIINRRLRSRVFHRSLSLPVALLLVVALLVPTLSLASPTAAPAPRGDLGDAPDGTNHPAAAMNAYPFVLARYPSVFDPGTGLPQGPLHLFPRNEAWLGAGVSSEFDADQLPDPDGLTNIDPAAFAANRDRFDDGVFPVNAGGIPLPQCQTTRFRFIVTGAAAPPLGTAYVNVWFDFNRDGDWADTLTCSTPAGAKIVYEWAVRNQIVPVVAGSVVFVTNPFPSFHPTGNKNTWMRISLAEQRAPLAPNGLADGRGPANGYRYGETEDYRLRYNTTTGKYQP